LLDTDTTRVVGRAEASARSASALPDMLDDAARSLASAFDPKGAARVPKAPQLSAGGKQDTARTPQREGGGVVGFGGLGVLGAMGTRAAPNLDDDDVTLHDAPLDPSQAAALCHPDDAIERWVCGDGTSADVVRTSTGLAVTAGEVHVRPLEDGACFRGVELDVSDNENEVSVDLEHAVFIVDGRAIPAVAANDIAAQAPARAHLVVQLFTRANCIESVPTTSHASTVALSIAFDVGGVPARGRFVRKQTLQHVPAPPLLALVPRPEVPRVPDDSVALDDDGPGWPWTLGGAGIGLGVGVLAGVFVGTVWMPKSADVAQRTEVAAGWTSLLAPVVGVPAALIGLTSDLSARSAFDARKQRTLAQQRAQRRQTAYDHSLAAARDD
jgi:hypothetical protein